MKKFYSKLTNRAVKLFEDSIAHVDSTENPLFLVALSGGSDSLAVAIAGAYASQKKKANFRVGAIIVNHKLQEETDRVTGEARETALNLGLSPVIVKEVNIVDNGEGMEASARLARYNAINEAVVEYGASAVLMGHSLNDQAEQVFLGLLRGSGVRSLSGIASHRDNIIRPFLSLSREETQQICVDNDVEYWVDPHNSSLDYNRVRVRKNILPVLEENFGSGVLKNLAKTCQISREDADVLDYVTDNFYGENIVVESGVASVSVDCLTRVPIGLRKRVFRKIIVEVLGGYGSHANVNEVDVLVESWSGQKYVSVENGFVWRSNNTLFFSTNLP